MRKSPNGIRIYAIFRQSTDPWKCVLKAIGGRVRRFRRLAVDMPPLLQGREKFECKGFVLRTKILLKSEMQGQGDIEVRRMEGLGDHLTEPASF